MKRKHKSYSRPKRPFDKARLEEEAVIKKNFGLKNKKEIWKADAKITSMRGKAKKLISSSEEDQKQLFDRLNKIGLDVHSIADVLGLTKEDYLRRRLQTVVFDKNLAKSVKEARQLITHKKVLVDGKAIGSPSYIVPVELEGKITIKPKKEKAPKKEAKTEEVAEETKEEAQEENKEEEKKE
jgi:small subunit ribosomal protein S4